MRAYRNIEIVAYYNMSFVPLSADEIIAGGTDRREKKLQKSPGVVSSFSF
jgi:hypothetical protein